VVSLARFLRFKDNAEQLQIGKVLRVVADRIRKAIHDGRDGLAHQIVIDLMNLNWFANCFQHRHRQAASPDAV